MDPLTIDSLALKSPSLERVPETYKDRQERFLAAFADRHRRKKSPHEDTYPVVADYWTKTYQVALPGDKLEQMISAENTVLSDLILKLKSILENLPSDEERDSMIEWIQRNLIEDRSFMGIPRNEINFSVRTKSFTWPNQSARPVADTYHPSLDSLPKSYVDVIAAWMEFAVCQLVLYRPFDEKIQEYLLLVQSLKEGGLSPENFGSSFSMRTLLFMHSNGETYIRLDKRAPQGQPDENHEERSRRIKHGYKNFMEQFDQDHPLAPSTVAKIALMLDGFVKDRNIRWGELQLPGSGLELTKNQLYIKRDAQVCLDALREQAGEERIKDHSGEFANRIRDLVLNAKGPIKVNSVREANLALGVVTESARAAMATTAQMAAGAQEELTSKVMLAEDRAISAEIAKAELQRGIDSLKQKLEASENESAHLKQDMVDLRRKLDSSDNDKEALEAVASFHKMCFQTAYTNLQRELETNSGFLGTYARLAAYGKFLETVLGLFK